MAALDYDEILAVAQELLADAGRVVTFEQLSAAAADPSKPWLGPGVPTLAATDSAPAVFVPVSSASELGSLAVSKELLARCEQVLLTAPSGTGFDMAQCTSIQDGGSRWRVTWLQTLKPGPLVVLYALGVAR